MEGKGGLRAPLGLCRPRRSPLSAEVTFPASPRSDLGGWGRPRRRHGLAPRGGFQQRAREARLGSESARGTGIDTGTQGQLGSPGPPHATGSSHWREAAGQERGNRRQANPRGVGRAGFHFGFGWRAERSGPPSPAVPAAWHGQAAPAASAAPPSAGCDRAVCKAAAARRRPPPAGRGQAQQGTPGRARGPPPCAGRGRKATASPGTAALHRLRGKQDPAAVRCTGACSWQPPASRCLQGRGYKLNIVCAAGTKYPGLTGMGERRRDCVRPPMMNNPGRPPGCGGQIALGSAKRSAATSARASGAVGLSPAGSGSTHMHIAAAERTALPPPGPPARGPGRSLSISLGRRMGNGRVKCGSEVWRGAMGVPRSGDARQQVEAAPLPRAARGGGHCGERSPGLRGARPADLSSPRPPGRLVGTNTSCSGPGPRSWPGGGAERCQRGRREGPRVSRKRTHAAAWARRWDRSQRP